MKMVQRGSAPIGSGEGMDAIKALAESGDFADDVAGGKVTDVSDTRAAYVAKLMEFVDVSALTPMKVLVNAGNGAAGPTFDAIADALAGAGAPLEFHPRRSRTRWQLSQRHPQPAAGRKPAQDGGAGCRAWC